MTSFQATAWQRVLDLLEAAEARKGPTDLGFFMEKGISIIHRDSRGKMVFITMKCLIFIYFHVDKYTDFRMDPLWVYKRIWTNYNDLSRRFGKHPNGGGEK